MKNNLKRIPLFTLRIEILFSIFLIILSSDVFSQAVVKVPFTQRTSQQVTEGFKGKRIYHLRGDFMMLGNANIFSSPYTNLKDNNSMVDMVFSKLNGDPSEIRNSSSASLQLPKGIDQVCTKIIYAGLYWAGTGDVTSDYILRKSGNRGDGMNKKKVKFRIPGGKYQDLTSDEIYYDVKGNEKGMYTGYCDVTKLVQSGGFGAYSVADIATFEGKLDYVGNASGWGMVVIYENSASKWRDVTIFDGFAFTDVSHNNETGKIDVDGFTSAENGDINVKMGVMAVEGDRNFEGDFFSIRKVDKTWLKLSHNGNSVDNFFNSSIFTGNNDRTPNNINNFGIDISMFDLPNTNNSIIANKQTATSFAYGTDSDIYSIFNITFAVDAFVPNIEALNYSVDGVANNTSVTPGQILEFEIDVTNKGTEAIKNGRVEVMLPPNLHFVSATPVLGNRTNVSWSHPNSTDFKATPGGLITWTIPEIPMGATPKEIVGKLKYKVRVTENCILLTTSSGTCGLTALITGTITGVGVNSSAKVEAPFITSYSQGACNGNPVYDPYKLNIDLDATMINSCSDVVNGVKQFKAYCSIAGNAFSRQTVASAYPAGTKFYRLPPGTLNYLSSEIIGDFPLDANAKGTNYYAVIVGMDEKCSLLMSIQLLVVNTQPTANNIKICTGVVPIPFDAQLSEYGKQNNYTLFYFDSAASNTPLASAPIPTTAGAFTYFVAEGSVKNNVICMGPKVQFNVEIRSCKIITNPMIPARFKNPK